MSQRRHRICSSLTAGKALDSGADQSLPGTRLPDPDSWQTQRSAQLREALADVLKA